MEVMIHRTTNTVIIVTMTINQFALSVAVVLVERFEYFYPCSWNFAMTSLAATLRTYQRECFAIRAAMVAFFAAAVIYGGGKGSAKQKRFR